MTTHLTALPLAGLFREREQCCKDAEGKLCASHAPSVLPQLAQPFWYRDAKSGDMTPSFEPADNVRSRQRHERRERVKRHSRLLAGLSGARVSPVRVKRAA